MHICENVSKHIYIFICLCIYIYICSCIHLDLLCSSGPLVLQSLECSCLGFSISGTTHKREWDKFSRQVLDRQKFPVSLASYCLQSKTDLFNDWLECSGDWSRVELNYQRRVSTNNKYKKGRRGMKPREIIKQYGEENLGDVSKVYF